MDKKEFLDVNDRVRIRVIEEWFIIYKDGEEYRRYNYIKDHEACDKAQKCRDQLIFDLAK